MMQISLLTQVLFPGEKFIDVIVKQLSLKKSHRSTAILSKLAPALSSLSFFKQRNLQSHSLVDVLSRLNVQRLPANTEVFRIGSVGYNFYLILDGVVEIKIIAPN
jgi:hypothetical protein